VKGYSQWFLVSARILMAMVFLLNGFGIINQAIPAKEMMERGVPAAVVPLAMLAGRILEIVAGFGLAFGIFPRWCASVLFAFLVPATFVSHSFWLAAGTPQFQGQLINFSKNMAIWGGLIFIAGTRVQPSLPLPSKGPNTEKIVPALDFVSRQHRAYAARPSWAAVRDHNPGPRLGFSVLRDATGAPQKQRIC
jgi:putative oxidoreductase